MSDQYTDKHGQTWTKSEGIWGFDDGAGGRWFVTDMDMDEIKKEEQLDGVICGEPTDPGTCQMVKGHEALKHSADPIPNGWTASEWECFVRSYR